MVEVDKGSKGPKTIGGNAEKYEVTRRRFVQSGISLLNILGSLDVTKLTSVGDAAAVTPEKISKAQSAFVSLIDRHSSSSFTKSSDFEIVRLVSKGISDCFSIEEDGRATFKEEDMRAVLKEVLRTREQVISSYANETIEDLEALLPHWWRFKLVIAEGGFPYELISPLMKDVSPLLAYSPEELTAGELTKLLEHERKRITNIERGNIINIFRAIRRDCNRYCKADGTEIFRQKDGSFSIHEAAEADTNKDSNNLEEVFLTWPFDFGFDDYEIPELCEA